MELKREDKNKEDSGHKYCYYFLERINGKVYKLLNSLDYIKNLCFGMKNSRKKILKIIK